MRVPVIYRASYVEYIVRILVAMLQEYVNTYSTCGVATDRQGWAPLRLCKGSQQGGTISGHISVATLDRFRPLFSLHLRQLSQVSGTC